MNKMWRCFKICIIYFITGITEHYKINFLESWSILIRHQTLYLLREELNMWRAFSNNPENKTRPGVYKLKLSTWNLFGWQVEGTIQRCSSVHIQGVPKKTLFCLWRPISLVLNDLLGKFGPVLKTTCSQLSFEHKNKSILFQHHWEN